jgi:hypothetical protein
MRELVSEGKEGGNIGRERDARNDESRRRRPLLYRRTNGFARTDGANEKKKKNVAARNDGASTRWERPDFGKAVAVKREDRLQKRVDESTEQKT